MIWRLCKRRVGLTYKKSSSGEVADLAFPEELAIVLDNEVVLAAVSCRLVA